MNKDNNFIFNYNINSYKGFVDYFFNLEIKEKDNIIKECFKYVKNNYKPQNKTLYKIYGMYKILLHKLKYDKLDIKERFIYEYINAYLIYNNLFLNNELFEKYCNIYLNNITLDNIECKLKLIVQDVINVLNNKYHLDVKNINIISDNDSNTIAYVCWGNLKQEIFTYDVIYDVDVNNNNLTLTISELIFYISHEFKHVIQKLDCYYTDNPFNKSAFEDFCLRSLSIRLYDKYHNYFETEKDANNFALDTLNSLIYKYFDKSKIVTYDLIRAILIKRFMRLKRKDLKIYNIKKKIFLKTIETFNIETKAIKSYKKLLEKTPSDTYDVIF